MPDREIKVALFILIGFLIYFYSAVSAAFQSFPYPLFERSIVAAQSIADALNIEEYSRKIRWAQPEAGNTGMVFKDMARVQSGATLYSSTHDTVWRLVDHDGEILHSWSLNFSDVWDNQDHIIALHALDDSYFYARDFHLYPNGDLLVMIAASGVTPWGMGLVKLDKESNVLWKHQGYTNNDFTVADDGMIYVIEHEIEEQGLEIVDLPFLPYLEDHIVQLSPEGEELARQSLIQAIARSPYKDLLKQLTRDEEGDPTHSNSIEILKTDRADIHWWKAGNMIISVRNIDTMVVYDYAADEVVHAAGLKARMQHDIDALENGNLLVFDNQGSFTEGGYSRVYEFDPITQEIVWNFDPAPTEGAPDFETRFWGCQQRLPNGNTLIAHAEAGRIIEVAPDYDVVWDYRTPLMRDVDGVSYTATVTTVERIAPRRLGFLKDTLQRSGPE